MHTYHNHRFRFLDYLRSCPPLPNLLTPQPVRALPPTTSVRTYSPGKEMVDYIADYLEGIRERRVFPDVKPGYMCDLVPPRAPQQGEQWSDVMADVERVIMPGVSPTLRLL